MYKSGKNWMVAGLMTTAVLAGLTLGNVNTTEAHAAVYAPVTATSAAKQNVSQSEYDAQQATVNSDATAVSDQQAKVNAASSALASAQSSNKAVAAVEGAESAAKTAWDKYNQLSDSVKSQNNAIGSLAAVEDAQHKGAVKDWNDNNRDAEYAKVSTNVANLQSEANSLSTAWSNAKASVKSDDAAKSDAYVALDKAKQASDAYVDENGEESKALADSVSRAQGAVDYWKHQGGVDQKLANQYSSKLWNKNNDLNKAKERLAQLNGSKKLVDEYNKAEAQLKPMRAKRDSDNKLLDAATQADSDVRTLAHNNYVPRSEREYNTYKNAASDAAAQLKRDEHATAKIQHDNDVKALNDAKSELATNQGKLAKAQSSLKDDQAKLTAAEKALAADEEGSLQYYQDQASVNTYKGYVGLDKDDIDQFNDWIRGSQKKVDDAQKALNDFEDSDAYKSYLAEIEKDQTLVDNFKLVEANWEAYKDGLNSLTPLQTKLAQEQATLAALQNVYNTDKAILDSMTVNGQTPVVENGSFGNVTLGQNGDYTVPGNPTFYPTDNGATVAVLGSKVIAATEGTTGVKAEWDNYAEAQQMVDNARAEANKLGHAVDINIPAHYKNFRGTVKVTVLPDVKNPNTDQPTDNNNENQNNNNESSKTTTEGQKTSSTVKTSQKSVATVKAGKANAAAKSKAAKQAKKLPQTGNNSAAVVALGALSGMLGLGLAAKKREF